MSKIVGLDLGTNSIGWAVVDSEAKKIESAGSRIIPMDAEQMSNFEKGNSVSFTADRTRMRGVRRLRERFLLRRERLLRVLNLMGFLPEHFAAQLDRYGHLPLDSGARIAWREGKDGKPEFLFREEFEEMVDQMRHEGHEGPIPYDWTIYYLRQKALHKAIGKEELAWILLQMNQKRGYNQLRGKDEDALSAAADKEYHELKVIAVEEDTSETNKKGKPWYNIKLENGWVYRRQLAVVPDWVGKTKGFVATFKLDKEGNRKSDQPSLSSPSEDDWGLRKIKTEHDIKGSGMTIGQFIYNSLLHNPERKIIGDLVQTVDRSLYRDELHKILDKQKEFHAELTDRDLYRQCVEELYPNNEAHQHNIAQRDFTYFIAEDILLYQRPLKSKLSLIADCPYEMRGERPAKCIAKSHPLFQEFRLWQFLANLKIYDGDSDITPTLLPDDNAYTQLFDNLATQKSIDQKGMLKYFKLKSVDNKRYRWNYVADRSYPTGETRATLLGGLHKAGIELSFLTSDKELQLWHILYSVDDQQQYRKALNTFACHQDWDEEKREAFVKAFERLTIYKNKEYGAYSHKAIARLLPLMRRGKYWNVDAIDAEAQRRIEHIITGEVDDNISPELRKRFSNLQYIEQCSGLNTYQACYLVYGRHSEAQDAERWTSPSDIDNWLKTFRHGSLNNPIVEQVVAESMRVVRDIWKQVGHIDEVHIEMGRELKKTAAERASLSQAISDGEATNQRIRLLLQELADPEYGIENVRPHSPSQIEILKIYEDGAIRSVDKLPDDIQAIHKQFTSGKNMPSHNEIVRYKCWLEQKYRSPYTDRPIPLSKLFTPAYEIEHVIPQSLWFDDSLSNKVICEAEVNRMKSNMLGHNFIVKHHGQRVPLSMGGTVDILEVEQYEALVKELYARNRTKLHKMMLDEIPSDFNARQLQDSRYISRLMMHLLSNIVRNVDEEGNIEKEATSRNVIPCTGAITDRLKHEWGIDEVWNRIILPRFERLNRLTGSEDYTSLNSSGHHIPTVPMELKQGFSKKRIDHRHHAMDAIVIACTTRDHVNLLNNEAAGSNKRYDLQHKLRIEETYIDANGNKRSRFGQFRKPWDTFTEDTFQTLNGIVVSFKQNLRVINKTSNHYTHIQAGKHIIKKQTEGDSWAIRKPMHKDTVYGEVRLQMKKYVPLKKALENINNIVSRELREKLREKKEAHHSVKQIEEYLTRYKEMWSEVKEGKIEVYYYTGEENGRTFAVRKVLADVMNGCTTQAAAEKAIAAITDSGIRSILMAHLLAEGGNPSEAFSADGLERMNQNITTLNGGHPHMPIKRVRVFEQANKFSIGKTGQKSTKFVEAAKGTNLFFVIYRNAKGKRGFATAPLNIVIELQKEYEKEWQLHLAERLGIGGEVLYILSPGDLVYVPEEGEKPTVETICRERIYKVVSCDGDYISCIPVCSATPILPKVEYESPNKMKTTIDKKFMIRNVCLPIKIDRLGNIIKIG